MIKINSVGLALTSDPIIFPQLSDSYKKSILFLKKDCNLKVIEPEEIHKRYFYSAGTPRYRAAYIQKLFQQDFVDAIICLWGGETANQILPYLDYKKIIVNKKPFIGASDATVLLNGIFAKTGLITYHWANLLWLGYEKFKGTIGQETGESFQRFFLKGEDQFIPFAERIKMIRGKKMKGRLIGGNLATFEKLIGTTFMPDCRGAILAIEEVEQMPYTFDSRLHHFKQAGILSKLNGILLGYCHKCTTDDPESNRQPVDIVLEATEEIDLPVAVFDYFGHNTSNSILPIGGIIELPSGAILR